ncbi:MAG: hypothetical protein Q9181_002237 [Wetmoreana brouardii]
MPPSSEKPQNGGTRKDQSSTSPATEHQEAIEVQDASSASQSAFSEGLSTSTSPYKATTSTSPTSTIAQPTQSQQSFHQTTPSLPTPRAPSVTSPPGPSGTEARSPANNYKRAPASRSSHGIPTANGPPPALITQRSYHAEPWRRPSATDPPKQPTASPHQPPTNGSRTARNSLDTRSGGDAIPTAMNGAMLGHTTTPTAPSFRYRDDPVENDDTIRTHHGSVSNGVKPDLGQEDDHTFSSNEDLFLHLARTDSEAGNVSDSTRKTGRRGSQLGLSPPRSVRTSQPFGSRPASSGGAIGDEQPGDRMSYWAQSGHLGTLQNGRYSSLRDRSYAASAHPLDQKQHRFLHSELASKASFTPRLRNGSNREASPDLPGSYGRRQSIPESTPGMSYRNSKRSRLSGNNYDSSPIAYISPNVDHNRPLQPCGPEGTESTISTTAPSTVWDELDDLKSRIHKLELTGKLPASSGAAMKGAATERPTTASTTMTTASLSPKHGRAKNSSPEASTVKGTNTSNLHPLLHSALAKAKALIDPRAFKALENTASDALDMAVTTQGNSYERQLRRKADSMCRSLTELCIALSEEQSSVETSASAKRTGSTGVQEATSVVSNSADDTQRLRASSQEPERPSSRIMSRLEARRTSLLASSNAATPPKSHDGKQTASPTIHQDPLIPQRTSSVLLHRRRTANSNSFPTATTTISNNNNNTITSSSRPVPRGGVPAAAEQQQRPSPVSRISREYTSQHPLPTLSNSQQRSPSTLSSTPASSSSRRSYFPYTNSSNNNSPSTPVNGTIQPGNRRYLATERQMGRESTTPSSSAEAQRKARIASLGQYRSGTGGRLRLVEGEQG